MIGSPSLGLGEYLTVWAIIIVVAFAVLGYLMGAAAGGALVFAVLGGLAVIILYALTKRLWNLLLHGSFTASADETDDGGTV